MLIIKNVTLHLSAFSRKLNYMDNTIWWEGLLANPDHPLGREATMCSIIEIRTPTEFTIRYETDDSLSGEHVQRTRNVKLISAAARGSTVVDTKGRKGVVRGRSVDPRGRSEKTRTSSEAMRGGSAEARGSKEKDGGWTLNNESSALLPYGESNREADIVKNGWRIKIF